MSSEPHAQPLWRNAVLSGALASFLLLSGCPDWDAVEPVSFDEAAPLIAPDAPKSGKVNDAFITMLDEALERVQDDASADTADVELEIREMVAGYPETMNSKQIMLEYEHVMARFDVVISTTRTPEARAPIGQLKKTTSRAFEEAIAEEYERGEEDAEAEVEAAEAEGEEIERQAQAEAAAEAASTDTEDGAEAEDAASAESAN